MSDLHTKKISELKRHLREIRAAECPPISKMKKADVIAAIEGHHAGKAKANEERSKKALEGLRKVEAETKARNVERKKTHVKKVVEQMEEKKSAGVGPKKEKRTMTISLEKPAVEPKADVGEVPKTGRGGLIKGSQEARDYMKRLRDARQSKKEAVD